MRNHAEVKVNKYLFALVLEILLFKSYFRSHLSLCRASNRAAIYALHTHRVPGVKLYWKVQWRGNVTATVPKAAELVISNFCQDVQELLTLQRAVQLCAVTWHSTLFSWHLGKLWSEVLVLAVRSCCSYLNNMVCLEGNFLADLIPSGSEVILHFRPSLKMI